MRKNSTFLFTVLFMIYLNFNVFAQTTYYVKPDAGSTAWNTKSNVYSDLQLAIDDLSAAGGGEIWVSAGTYKPTVTYDGSTGDDKKMSFKIKNNVSILGGFVGDESSIDERADFGFNQINETILSGDIDTNKDSLGFASNNWDIYYNEGNSYHVLFIYNLTGNITVDGFTITGGNPQSSTYASGGGIYCYQTTLTVKNCNLTLNESFSGGGFGCDYNGTKTITLSQNKFFNNKAIMNNGKGSAANFASVKGITIDRNLFYDNQNTESASQSCYGTISFMSCNNTIITNNILANNESSNDQPGLYIINSDTFTISNNTFVNNTRSTGAGYAIGMKTFGNQTNLNIYNNIIWGNTLAIYLYKSGSGNYTATIDHCAIQGNINGTYTGNNIALNTTNNGVNTIVKYVRFNTPSTFTGTSGSISQQNEITNANWSLTDTSACIDAGNDTNATYTYDFNGSARIQNCSVDIGAIETPYTDGPYDYTSITVDIADSSISNTATKLEYSLNSTDGFDGSWHNCLTPNTTGIDFGYGGNSLYLRVKKSKCDNYEVLKIAVENVPVYTINYLTETTNETFATTDEYAYSNDMLNAVTGTDIKLSISPDQDYYFRKKATSSTVASPTGYFYVAQRPDAPTNTLIDDDNDLFDWTNNNNFDDQTLYEYSTDSGKVWTPVIDKPISIGDIDLPIGYVQIRVAASNVNENYTGLTLASDQTFTKVSTSVMDLNKKRFSFYPNPISNMLYISSVFPADAIIKITDMNGKIVLKQTFANTINMNRFASGIYIINITSSKLQLTEKIIKQ